MQYILLWLAFLAVACTAIVPSLEPWNGGNLSQNDNGIFSYVGTFLSNLCGGLNQLLNSIVSQNGKQPVPLQLINPAINLSTPE